MSIRSSIVDTAERQSVALTPGELAFSPERFRRADGTSVFKPRHSTVYTSAEVLAAEDRLLAHTDDRNAPTAAFATSTDRGLPADSAVPLTQEQAEAVTAIATSARRLDLLVGPAGAGKTTTLHALRAKWEESFGTASVIGLAPSAVTARVLSDDLGIACENTAKWLHDQANGRTALLPNQLEIVDEATLADTRALDQVTAMAAHARAKAAWLRCPVVSNLAFPA